MSFKILFYTMRLPSNGSSRIHAYQYGPVFEDQGAQVKFNPPFPSFLDGKVKTFERAMQSNNRLIRCIARQGDRVIWYVISPIYRTVQLLDIFRCDVVIIQKGVTRWFEYRLFERLILFLTHSVRKKFIYHFDDILQGKNMTSVSQFLMQKADFVITVNRPLVEYAKKFNSRVDMIPENIRNQEIVSRNQIRKKVSFPVEIGWIGLGGGYKFKSLEGIGGAIEKISKEYNIKLKIVSDMKFSFKKIENIDIENIKWDFEQEDTFSCDIGINPVPQEMAMEGKGSFKLIKYMAHGIPSVTSWTCDEFNRNEDTCLIASDSDDWYTQIKKLIVDDRLRVVLASNGINEAKKYSTDTLGYKYLEIIKRTVSREGK